MGKLHAVQALALGAVLTIGLVGCKQPQGQSIWKDIIAPCITGDLDGKLLYFGPANNLPPGTPLSKVPDGNFSLGRSFPEVLKGENHSIGDYISFGAGVNCSGKKQIERSLDAGLVLKAADSPVNGLVDFAFKRGRVLSVSADVTWDYLDTGAYQGLLDELGPDHILSRRVRQENTFVIFKAARASNLTAELEFTRETKAQIEAKYNQELGTLGLTEAEAKFDFQSSGETTLKIVSTNDFYIAGAMAPASDLGLAEAGVKYIGVDWNASVYGQ